MQENDEDQKPEITPERPLECGECKKSVAVIYTEIVGKTITHTCMCNDCPELQKRLHGTVLSPAAEAGSAFSTGLACGNCGTTLNAVRVGSPLGCSECYVVFEDVLLGEILSTGHLPARLATTKKSMPVHIGRASGEITEMNPSLRLLALNEALTETLKREDYEQAASLRDQIKALTENTEKPDEPK